MRATRISLSFRECPALIPDNAKAHYDSHTQRWRVVFDHGTPPEDVFAFEWNARFMDRPGDPVYTALIDVTGVRFLHFPTTHIGTQEYFVFNLPAYGGQTGLLEILAYIDSFVPRAD
jgi:hypothetical protein